MVITNLPPLTPLNLPQVVVPEAIPQPRDVRLVPLARSAMRTWVVKHLKTVQGGLCPLCLKEIDLSIPKEGVVDHDHDTGRIRGVLHRSCNAAEGKATNAIMQWGCKSKDYPSILAYLKRLVAYLESEPTRMLYHSHKTPDERREARNKKARDARARVRAATELKRRKAKDAR